jgi:hypothetical protein
MLAMGILAVLGAAVEQTDQLEGFAVGSRRSLMSEPDVVRSWRSLRPLGCLLRLARGSLESNAFTLAPD